MLTGKPLLTMTPAFAAWNTVARFDDYETAQRAVDRLSDDGFPVETLDIVGSTQGRVGRIGRWTTALFDRGQNNPCLAWSHGDQRA